MLQHEIKITAEDNLCRVDRWLRSRYKLPYTLVQKLFRKNDVIVNSKRVDSQYLLRTGDLIRCYGINLSTKISHHQVSEEDSSKLLHEIKNNIIFEDQHLVAINKPYAVAVQNGSKIKISIDTILPDLCEATKCRLVHRLDRYTTGILVVAKTKESSTDLVSLFKGKGISKTYLAVLEGVPRKKEGVIISKLKKSDLGDKEKVFSSDDGKDAITEYKILSISKDRKASLVEFRPVTGRTHQIRVHASEELHCPILGDSKYKLDGAYRGNIKMHLHAYKIQFFLYGKKYVLEAPLPDHLLKTIQKDQLQL